MTTGILKDPVTEKLTTLTPQTTLKATSLILIPVMELAPGNSLSLSHDVLVWFPRKPRKWREDRILNLQLVSRVVYCVEDNGEF